MKAILYILRKNVKFTLYVKYVHIRIIERTSINIGDDGLVDEEFYEAVFTVLQLSRPNVLHCTNVSISTSEMNYIAIIILNKGRHIDDSLISSSLPPFTKR
jgi:hypothetical protein